MSANFTPDMTGYKGLSPFRFWCQKTLPLVYDDSLSYYELLCKVVSYINNLITDVAAAEENVDKLLTAYNQLQEYVNNYFDGADFQQKIDDSLDRYAEDGTLSRMVNTHVSALLPYEVGQQIGPVVDEDLGPVVDLKLPAAVESKIAAPVATQLPAVVQSQIGGVVGNQIGDVVADQIDEVVADQITDAVSPLVHDEVTGLIRPAVATELPAALQVYLPPEVQTQLPGAIGTDLETIAPPVIEDWLDAHPEATTSVPDGSISFSKLATDLQRRAGIVGTYFPSDFTNEYVWQVNQYAVYQGIVYRCIKTTTVGQAWNASEWTTANMNSDLFYMWWCLNYLSQSITTIDSSPATSAHEAGEYFIYYDGAHLYRLAKASSNIAVGDNLTVNGNFIYSSVANMIADLKVEIADLKSALTDDIYTDISLTLTPKSTMGYYNTTTMEFVAESTSMVTNPIDCEEGDIFVLPVVTQLYSRAAIITFDEYGNVLTCTNTLTDGTGITYTCNALDKKISFGCLYTRNFLVLQKTGTQEIKDAVKENESAIDNIAPAVFGDGSETDITSLVVFHGYRNGSQVTENSNARTITVGCSIGDRFKYSGKVSGLIKYYYILDKNNNVLSYDTFTGDAIDRIVDITQPNAYYISFSFYVGNSSTFTLKKVNLDYTKYKTNEKPYSDQTWLAFGDSITYGVDGGYTTYVEEKTGATVDNYGHPGDTIANALYVVTDGDFGTYNNQTKLCSDYSNGAVASLMIGTNGGVPANWEELLALCPPIKYGQNLANMPFIRDGVTISNEAEYFALFPDNVAGKYCFMVEWMMYKNPNMKIFLITPPPRNTLEFDMKNAHDMIVAIGNRYGIPVIDCYENCMINLQNFNQYSGDGTHLNAKGNAIWGKYIGENIKRFGETFN